MAGQLGAVGAARKAPEDSPRRQPTPPPSRAPPQSEPVSEPTSESRSREPRAAGLRAASALDAAAEEAEGIVEAFRLIDANDDGELSRSEVIKACRSSERIRVLLSLPRVIRQEDGTRDAFEKVFQRLDQDDSKRVSLDEFLRVFGRRASLTSQGARPPPPPRATTPLTGPSSQPAGPLAPVVGNLSSLSAAAAALLLQDSSALSEPSPLAAPPPSPAAPAQPRTPAPAPAPAQAHAPPPAPEPAVVTMPLWRAPYAPPSADELHPTANAPAVAPSWRASTASAPAPAAADDEEGSPNSTYSTDSSKARVHGRKAALLVSHKYATNFAKRDWRWPAV